MRGLSEDERWALSRAGSNVEVAEDLCDRLEKRGLIRFKHREGEDARYGVTNDGWLALRLDAAARRLST